MPYVADTQLTEEEKKAQEAALHEEQSAPSTGVSAGLFGDGAALSQKSVQDPVGSGFTNLKSYLQANEGQGVGLAENISSNIQKEGQQAQSAIDTASADYQTKLNAAIPSSYQELIDRAKSNPSQFVQNQEDVNKFKNIKQGVFSGPSTFQETAANYGNLAQDAQNLSQAYKNTLTEQGQNALLNRYNPNVTRGSQELNQLILSRDKSGAVSKTLTEAAEPYSKLKETLAQQEAALNAQRAAALETVTQAKNYATENFVTPGLADLSATQAAINARQSEASLDLNKNAAINSLINWVQNGSTVFPTNEEQLFLPSGVSATDFYGKGFNADLRTAIPQGQLSQADWDNAISQNATNILSRLITSQTPYQSPEIMNVLNRYESGYYDNPLTGLKSEYAVNNPDWLNTYFPGTAKSSIDNPTAAHVATQDEYAKIMALQNLLDQSQYFTPEQSAQAGTYTPASIGQYTNPADEFAGVYDPVTNPDGTFDPYATDPDFWRKWQEDRATRPGRKVMA